MTRVHPFLQVRGKQAVISTEKDTHTHTHDALLPCLSTASHDRSYKHTRKHTQCTCILNLGVSVREFIYKQARKSTRSQDLTAITSTTGSLHIHATHFEDRSAVHNEAKHTHTHTHTHTLTHARTHTHTLTRKSSCRLRLPQLARTRWGGWTGRTCGVRRAAQRTERPKKHR
jgi:ABC-type Zn2+ transport system substrate-binding protein/surface adhesin